MIELEIIIKKDFVINEATIVNDLKPMLNYALEESKVYDYKFTAKSICLNNFHDETPINDIVDRLKTTIINVIPLYETSKVKSTVFKESFYDSTTREITDSSKQFQEEEYRKLLEENRELSDQIFQLQSQLAKSKQTSNLENIQQEVIDCLKDQVEDLRVKVHFLEKENADLRYNITSSTIRGRKAEKEDPPAQRIKAASDYRQKKGVSQLVERTESIFKNKNKQNESQDFNYECKSSSQPQTITANSMSEGTHANQINYSNSKPKSRFDIQQYNDESSNFVNTLTQPGQTLYDEDGNIKYKPDFSMMNNSFKNANSLPDDRDELVRIKHSNYRECFRDKLSKNKKLLPPKYVHNTLSSGTAGIEDEKQSMSEAAQDNDFSDPIQEKNYKLHYDYTNLCTADEDLPRTYNKLNFEDIPSNISNLNNQSNMIACPSGRNENYLSNDNASVSEIPSMPEQPKSQHLYRKSKIEKIRKDESLNLNDLKGMERKPSSIIQLQSNLKENKERSRPDPSDFHNSATTTLTPSSNVVVFKNLKSKVLPKLKKFEFKANEEGVIQVNVDQSRAPVVPKLENMPESVGYQESQDGEKQSNELVQENYFQFPMSNSVIINNETTDINNMSMIKTTKKKAQDWDNLKSKITDQLIENKENRYIYKIFDSSYILELDVYLKTLQLKRMIDFSNFKDNYVIEGSYLISCSKGLFVLTGESYNMLYYYNKDKNTMTKQSQLMYNHMYSSLLYCKAFNKLICFSGLFNNKVEYFTYDTLLSNAFSTRTNIKSKEKINSWSMLPSLKQSRYKASYAIINDDTIYCLFGLANQKSAADYIEKLNLTYEENDRQNCLFGDDSNKIQSMKWEQIFFSGIKCELTQVFLHYHADSNSILCYGGEQANGVLNPSFIQFDIKEKIMLTVAAEDSQGKSAIKHNFVHSSCTEVKLGMMTIYLDNNDVATYIDFDSKMVYQDSLGN